MVEARSSGMEDTNSNSNNSNSNKKQTIILNLFGGPGVGKSTAAAYICSKLKMLGVDAEYASEYAKDKVWELNKEVFKCQFYIVGAQAYRIFRLYGKVDVLVTDSPILLGVPYCQPWLKDAVIGEFNRYGDANRSYFIKRSRAFIQNGRRHSEEESKKLDQQILDILKETKTAFTEVEATQEDYDSIVLDIIKLVKGAA